MSLSNNLLVVALLLATYHNEFAIAKSISDKNANQKEVASKHSPQEPLESELRNVQKRAAFLDPGSNAFPGSDLMSDVSAGGWEDAAGFRANGDAGFRFGPTAQSAFRVTTRRVPTDMEQQKEEALRRLKMFTLFEASIRQNSPWNHYFGLAKRNGGSAYDDLMSKPRLLDRETREDGRRYLLWRKITGK